MDAYQSRFATLFILMSSLIAPKLSAQAGAVPVRTPSGVAISPDGTMLAYTIRGKEGTQLHLLPMPAAEQSKEKIVTPSDQTDCSSSSPVWSPDSRTLAYASTCTGTEGKSHQEQIFLYTPADGKSRQLTHVTGNLEQAAWSPDGQTIAFLFVQNATRTAGALDAMKPFAGVIGQDNIEIQGVYGVQVASGKEGWLVPASPKMYTYEFSWSPDSKKLATISAIAPGENNWWVAKLYTQYAQLQPSGDTPSAQPMDTRAQLILDPATVTGSLHGLQIAVPRWSPDGKRIAFIGGLMSDQGSTGGDVYVVDDKQAATPMDVTANIDGTPTYETWLDNNTLSFVEDRRGHILLPSYNVAQHSLIPGSVTDLGQVALSGGVIKNAVTLSNKGVLAFVSSSPEKAPEIWAGEPGKLHPVTHFNDAIKPERKTISVEWQSDGLHVQGWLTFPKNYDEHKHYPIATIVHGGPSSSVAPRWGIDRGSLSDYFIYQPNPRGSFGQGEAFTMANRKDFGYGDLRDILAGLDDIEHAFPSADKNREAIMGWSYGGYMTMWAVTQTPRFKAAMAGAGIANWQSYYGENQISEWMIPFFGASVYDDAAVYAKSSPINFIKNVRTPTLIIVGDRDGECPAPQSFEFWSALKAQGVKTQLVIYPNEGHGVRQPAHLKDLSERTEQWLNENLKESNP